MTRVVVVGDVLLDRDVSGRAERLCPDAPVPVVDRTHVADRPGGAGLASMLLSHAGVETTVVCGLADDAGGARLRELLASAGVTVHDCGDTGATTEKIRIRAGHQSLLRWDRGEGGAIGAPPSEARRTLAAADAVLVADYGRGVAAQPGVRDLLDTALSRGTPIVWDPHPRGATPLPRCTIVSPNHREAEAFAAIATTTQAGHLARATAHARHLRQSWKSAHVVVTLGSDGALLVSGDGAPLVVPVEERVDGGDPCGAGDAFAATAARALATGALPSEAVITAVAEAARFVARGGATAVGHTTTLAPTTSPSRRAEEVRAKGGTVVATGGCFDILHPGHVATLERARRLGDHLVVLLNSDHSVRRLKGPDRPAQPQADRAAILASLTCVDEVVVFDEDTPVDALRALRPDIFVKGGDYAAGDLPEAAALAEWGGTVVTVPFVDGRSTTRILERTAADPTPPTGGTHVV